MDKNADIQRFNQLMKLWLDAETSREQEQELTRLAHSLSGSKLCTPSMRRDIALITGLSSLHTSSEYSDEVEQILSQTVHSVPQRNYRFLWLRLSVVAAAVALIITIGVSLLKSSVIAEHGADSAITQTVSGSEALTAHVADKSAPTTTIRPLQEDSRPLKHAATPAKKRKEKPATPVQTLETREITDPTEASAILSQSCSLLAECMHTAETQSCQAIITMTDNINSISDII